eukprot:291007-Hanusia_phi.AAC.5
MGGDEKGKAATRAEALLGEETSLTELGERLGGNARASSRSRSSPPPAGRHIVTAGRVRGREPGVSAAAASGSEGTGSEDERLPPVRAGAERRDQLLSVSTSTITHLQILDAVLQPH